MWLLNLFSICLLSIQGYAAEYEISKIWSNENEHHPVWDAIEINEQGQILGINYELGMLLIDADGQITQIPKIHRLFNTAKAINNNGDVLIESSDDIGTSKSYIWNKTKDLISIDVFNSAKVEAIDINDINQVIGKYVSVDHVEDLFGKIKDYKRERAFLWENGVAIDINQEYISANTFGSIPHGYRISEINLTCINNHGDIAGYCLCVDINEQHGEKKILKAGFVPFFWDRADFKFLPIVLQNNFGLRDMKLSDEKIVVIPLEHETYVWESCKYFEEENILPITNDRKLNREAHIQNFEACAINDQGEILGFLIEPGNDTGEISSIGNRPFGQWTCTWALWKAKDNTLTSIDDLLGENKIQRDPSFMGIRELGYFVGINNKGQILGHAFFGGGNYRKICLLKPAIQ